MNQYTNYGSLRRKREKGAESLFKEIITEDISNLGREIDIQMQEAHVTPNRLNIKMATPRNIIIKLSKVKQRILKARERLFITYMGTP